MNHLCFVMDVRPSRNSPDQPTGLPLRIVRRFHRSLGQETSADQRADGVRSGVVPVGKTVVLDNPCERRPGRLYHYVVPIRALTLIGRLRYVGAS